MAKKSSTRETVVIGIASEPGRVRLLQLERDRAQPPGVFLANAARELAAAEGRADEQDAQRAAGVFAGDADPGSIVGLAEFTPNGDTPKDGDTDGTDPHAG